MRTKLLEQLKRHEGFRPRPYRDTKGFLTIGYGRNLDAKGISRPEGEILLVNDMDTALWEVGMGIPWAVTLDPVRRAVLVNMCLNMGLGGLMGFKKMLAALQAGDIDETVRQMKDSQWHGEVGPRADELERQMETGVMD